MDELCQEAQDAIRLADIEAERERLSSEALTLYIKLGISEGAWTGSHGGNDPDRFKMKGNLLKWWKEKAAKDPHPFSYCVRHLGKKFPDVDRICAWLKDQATGTTKWRAGQKESEIEEWEPTLDDLRAVVECLREAEQETAPTQQESDQKPNAIVYGPDGTVTYER